MRSGPRAQHLDDVFHAPSLRMDCDHWGAAALAWFTTPSASSGRQSKFRHGSSLLFHQLNALCSAGSQWSRLSQMHPNPGQRGSLFFQKKKKKNPLWNEMFHTNQNRNGGKTKTLRSSRSWPRGKNSILLSLLLFTGNTFIFLGSKKLPLGKNSILGTASAKCPCCKRLGKNPRHVRNFFLPQKSYCFVLNARDKWTILPSHWNAL